MVFCPLGLLISEATLAKNLFTEMPAEAVRPDYFNFANTSFAISLALIR
jgi:hypothetical protein